ncbi:FkbM family methyltransferase [Brachyspira intermedia]|uniref:FkbM family methyltransferase n=1 Tax=Brachyspira intermedia TaxID=84377 RepID=UPI003007CA24
MDIKTINNFLWWIPFKEIRGYLKNAVSQNVILNNKCSFLKTTIEKNNNINFISQFDQDFLAYLYFNGKRNGFFVDIGAYDGVDISNTYLFEQLGWNGICIEADPNNFQLLKKNRKCDCYNLAMHSKSDEKLEFITSSNASTLNVLKSQASDSHIERMKSAENQKELKTIKVNSITFNDFMSRNYPDIKYIDFLSIDIEGGELIALKTIDFNKYSFGLITVENNFEEGVLINFMKEKGYKVLIDIGLDILFIKE